MHLCPICNRRTRNVLDDDDDDDDDDRRSTEPLLFIKHEHDLWLVGV